MHTLTQPKPTPRPSYAVERRNGDCQSRIINRVARSRGGNPVLVPETVMMQTPPPTIGAYASRLMQPSRLGIDLVIGIAVHYDPKS